MPSKRSRSKEREKKRKARLRRTEDVIEDEHSKAKEGMQTSRSTKSKEEKLIDKKADTDRKRICRANKSEGEREIEKEADSKRKKEERETMTVEERQRIRQESRDWMKIVRSTRLEGEEDDEKAANSERIRKLREEITEEKLEFERKNNKHKMRILRKKRTGKGHLLQNLKAKQGMRLLESEGRLREFSRRSARNVEEIRDWEIYMKRGEKYSEVLEAQKPDIVQIINEKIRVDKEKEKIRKENAKNGEWCYSGESGEYYWDGEGEPEYNDDGYECEGLTGEDLKKFREEENKMFEAFAEERKKNEQERRKQKERERKEAMNNPLKPLPTRELCEYERLREQRITEIKEAMAASNFFDDLKDYKKNIGLLQDAGSKKTKEDDTKDKNVKKKIKKS